MGDFIGSDIRETTEGPPCTEHKLHIPGLEMYSLFDNLNQSSCYALIEKETISHFANDDPLPLWAIAAQVATHLWSGEGERRGGNKYFPILKKYLADF